MTTYRILITGSRTWTDETVVEEALADQFVYARDLDLIPLVVSGACPSGADLLAERITTLYYGWDVERHPADWGLHGKRAGFIRNAEMVNLGADVCLAFIRDDSKGASHTADLAERAGIRTLRWIA